jgi:hypothetical protein
MKNQPWIYALLALLVVSCQHQPIIYTDPTATVTKVKGGDIYHNNDTIHMKVNMHDDDMLKDVYLYLRCDTDTFFGYAHADIAQHQFDLDTFWVLTGMVTGIDAFVTAGCNNKHGGEIVRNVPIFLVP